MWVMVAGLALFLGLHSVRIWGDGWRSKVITMRGEATWKMAYSLLSALGLGLVVWGFSLARQHPVLLWQPPVALRHLAVALMMVSFVLLAAAYGPGNQIKARLHHPMVLSVKVWALAHLLANGLLAQALLFGSFLLWAVLSFASARRRDRRQETRYSRGRRAATVQTVLIGLLVWALFAFVLHGWLIGVRPLG